jgi:hypothetical protein
LSKSRAARAASVREHLVSALQADLIGPYDPSRPRELLPRPPSRWYLTGFIAPEARRVAVVNEDDKPTVEDVEANEEVAAGSDDASSEPEEQKPRKRMLWPASVGLSMLLPPEVDRVTATVSWADYLPEPEEPAEPEAPTETAGDGAAGSGARTDAPRLFWRRFPRGPVAIEVALGAPHGRLPVPGSVGPGGEADDNADAASNGLEVEYQVLPAPGLPDGTRALSVFLVNRRAPMEGREADQALAFQVQLAVTVGSGSQLVPWPKNRGEQSDDEDDRTADLQYRDQREWAVGHGISAEAIPHSGGDGRVIGAGTVWMPRATVPLVQTRENLGADVTLGMDALADLTDGPTLRAALIGLADRYGSWIEGEARKAAALTGRRASFARQLVDKGRRARDRIVEGIELLVSDPQAREAFCLANRAMADQAKQRNKTQTDTKAPAWRPFQLAFLLLSLLSVADDRHDDRELVELIFFPTGGGKTEAYLGLAAFILILRRLRGAGRPDGGLGVAVLLRYTLRLLTLDQLGRAATLICALELLRQREPARLGDVRFSLGLWVGKAATANDVAGMKELLEAYREHPGDAIPCPLTVCPWCQRPLSRTSLDVREDGRFPEVRVGCVSTDGKCPFTLAAGEGIPVLFIDELLYRELPGFVIATVDKLAMLPFRGETAALFGRVVARDGRAFIGHMDGEREARRGQALPEGLRPPDLVIQDELHLISGPLGTMVGLYEMAVDGLSTRVRDGSSPLRPKVIASTATVRRARQQIRALFARPSAMFPPAGIDGSDSFFGTQERADQGHGRLYLGVAAPGRAVKALLLRVYVALLAGAQRAYQQGPDGSDIADAYMTLIGYFNTLRELGGMRRLVEDEVRTRCAQVSKRRPQDHPGPDPWFAERHLRSEPLELTSRESTQRITEAKRQLEQAYGGQQAVDVTLASNMISVGVDVPRLGLMVVAGQPKTTSEYIQATSRVGRHRERPGLVVVAFNAYRPRDRSHYEHFQAYHEAFYANVEATSVTPFSLPALERGLAGALVALTRLGLPELIPPLAAGDLDTHPDHRNQVLELVARRAETCAVVDAAPGDAEQNGRAVRARAQALFDSWGQLIASARKIGEQPRVYSRFDLGCRKRTPLLRPRLEEPPGMGDADAARFQAPTSMRDVEAPVSLWLARRTLGKAEAPAAPEQPPVTAEE